MDRYDPDYDLVNVMDKAQYGSWVRYDEAQAEIARLQAEVERLHDVRETMAVMWAKEKEQSDTARDDALEEAADSVPDCAMCGCQHTIRTLKTGDK